MAVIPVSRFKQFIAEAVKEAYNAKAALMAASPIPIVTGEFVLEINGTLVDDVGGVGINEIIRTTRSVQPKTTQTTTATQPETISETVVDPEVREEIEAGTEKENASGQRSELADESSTQASTQSDTKTGAETTDDTTEQAYGREVNTVNTVES